MCLCLWVQQCCRPPHKLFVVTSFYCVLNAQEILFWQIWLLTNTNVMNVLVRPKGFEAPKQNSQGIRWVFDLSCGDYAEVKAEYLLNVSTATCFWLPQFIIEAFSVCACLWLSSGQPPEGAVRYRKIACLGKARGYWSFTSQTQQEIH